MKAPLVDSPETNPSRTANLYTLHREAGSSLRKTLFPFEDENFFAGIALEEFSAVLEDQGYTESKLCELLDVESLQYIEPTHLSYYDRFRLEKDALGDLVRLFLIQAKVPAQRLQTIFSDSLLDKLVQLGVLSVQGEMWSSKVQIYCTNGLYLATDPRYIIHPEDVLNENPVMYVGLDSAGLTHVAPRKACDRLLDLCSGCGVQALSGSRYARRAIGVDINPRAIRFARFNAQLNGIRNVEFILGDLYGAVAGQKFDVILANPPFVPSPTMDLRFRDGGIRGENILARIVEGAAPALNPRGRLHIVTDLVDVEVYDKKLNEWWQGGPSHQLVLQTADRDDMQFSVPHCHAPFGQRFQEYNDELERWINNFHGAKIRAVNFGYILIHSLPESTPSSYFRRTISNPIKPIHKQIEAYFSQRDMVSDVNRDSYFLQLADGVRVRRDHNIDGTEQHIELHCPDNPYFTTYVIGPSVFRALRTIAHGQPQWRYFVNSTNKDLIVDLVLKGLLYLSKERKRDRSVSDRRVTRDRPASNQQLVTELQTETTPTCLSSYL